MSLVEFTPCRVSRSSSRSSGKPCCVAFFLVGVVELATRLILIDHTALFGGFMIATTMALVVGKAVLAANALPFLRRFDARRDPALIQFKTAVYWVVFFVAWNGSSNTRLVVYNTRVC